MRRLRFSLVALLLSLASMPFVLAQTGQPGQVQMTGSEQVDGSGQIELQLVNCDAIPRAIYSGTIVSTVVQQTYWVTVSSGAWSQYVWPNDAISCAGTVGNTQWQVTYVQNGTPVGQPESFDVTSNINPFSTTTQPAATTMPPAAVPGQDFSFHSLTLQVLTSNSVITNTLHMDAQPTPCASGTVMVGYDQNLNSVCVAAPVVTLASGGTVTGPVLFESGAQNGNTDFIFGCQNIMAALPSSVGSGYLGAVNDATTDDWRSIQTHIEYANSHYNPTGKENCVLVPVGQFVFKQPLNMCATLGSDGGSCSGTGIQVYGEGRMVSVLMPHLTYPGPDLDFGGSGGGGPRSGMSNVGIVSATGDNTTVGVLSSHGGFNGVAGDDFRLYHDSINLANSNVPGNVGAMYCATDTSATDDDQIWSSGPAVIAGGQLGLGAGTVSMTASAAGNTLTVTAMASGALGVGSPIYDTGALVAAGTYVTTLGTGTGGVGTYTISGSPQTVASETMTSNQVFSPFYRLSASDTGNPTGCHGNNGFTYFGLGGDNSWVSQGGGTVVQLTGSGAYYSEPHNNYFSGQGTMLAGHGIIDLGSTTGSSGNWVDLEGIRTEYSGTSTNIYAVMDNSSDGGTIKGVLTGADSSGTADLTAFGCDSGGSVAGFNLSVQIIGANSTTFSDCPIIKGITGSAGIGGGASTTLNFVPAGYTGNVANVNLIGFGTSVNVNLDSATTACNVILVGKGRYQNSSDCGSTQISGQTANPASGAISMGYAPSWYKFSYNVGGTVHTSNYYCGPNQASSTVSMVEWDCGLLSSLPTNFNLGLNAANTLTLPGGQVVTSSNWVPVRYSASWTPAAATVSSCVEQAVTVTGVQTGKIVDVSPPSAMSAHVWIGGHRVSAANTVQVDFCADATGGTPPSGTWLFRQ